MENEKMELVSDLLYEDAQQVALFSQSLLPTLGVTFSQGNTHPILQKVPLLGPQVRHPHFHLMIRPQLQPTPRPWLLSHQGMTPGPLSTPGSRCIA